LLFFFGLFACFAMSYFDWPIKKKKARSQELLSKQLGEKCGDIGNTLGDTLGA
jgi:hypothetical protein